MQRNHYYDFLRGLAIMMVVGIHTFCMSETNLQDNAIDVNTLVRQILNWAVPVFLAISGFFLCTKNLDTWTDMKTFWRRQMPKVYVPTMIVSLPFCALAIKHGNSPISAIMAMLACGFSIYYFVALIIQYYALLPIFKKANRGGNFMFVNIVNNNICGIISHVCGRI